MNGSNIVRGFPYPVLEEGNLSFPAGKYTPDIQMGADGFSATIHHALQGAPLISRLIEEGNADYACTVSIPKAGYRKLYRSNNPNQSVQWDRDSVGEPAILHPLIVCHRQFECKFSTTDGVSNAWIGRIGVFEPGSKVALGPFFRTASSMQSLLSFTPDSELDSGQFTVKPCSEDGFYFVVKVAPELHRFLQQPEDHRSHRNSIMTHIVSCCFEFLAKGYKKDNEEESWRSHRNLLALAADLESRGLPIWDADEFIPEKAATVLHPHQIPRSESDES